MSESERIITDPRQPADSADFVDYFAHKDQIWNNGRIHSYPIVDLGILPDLEILQALPYGDVAFDVLVSPGGDIGHPITFYDYLTEKYDPAEITPEQEADAAHNEHLMNLAYPALLGTICAAATDFRVRMGASDEDWVGMFVRSDKYFIANATKSTADAIFGPHLDRRGGVEYLASIGRATRYWDGEYTWSPTDEEDDNAYYEQQIAAMGVSEKTFPPSSLIGIDEHLLHAHPIFTIEDVGTDRFFATLSPELVRHTYVSISSGMRFSIPQKGENRLPERIARSR
jgi:hypothetical protein